MGTRRLTTLTSGSLYPLQSAALLATLARLVGRETVRSVSCPFRDPAVWRVLVDEQLRRAAASGLAPQVALGLAGPDAGLEHVPIAEWGGSVYIPYEGASSADLFIAPVWRVHFPEYGGEDGSLSAVVHGIESPDVGYFCHHLLTREDLGEFASATREDLSDGWIHYASRRPYLDAIRRWATRARRDDGTTPFTPWPL